MKEHPTYTGYFVTEDGEVFSPRKKLSQCNVNGYKQVHINKKQLYVHRLVAEIFIPNPHNYRCVNHINGEKSDNNVSNLEWCSHSHNQLHSISQGGYTPRGAKHKYTYTILVQSTGEIFQTTNLRGLWRAFKMSRQTFILSEKSKKTSLPLKILARKKLPVPFLGSAISL